MREVVVAQTGVGMSQPVVTERYTAPANTGWAAILSGTGATYSIEYTQDSPWNFGSTALFNTNANWFVLTGANALTASANGNTQMPVRALRVNITAGTGTVTFTVTTAGIVG